MRQRRQKTSRESFAWLNKENPQAALAVLAKIEAKLRRLEKPELTHMGRPGLVEGTRELIEYPYIIVYTVRDDLGEIVVVAIMHGAQAQ